MRRLPPLLTVAALSTATAIGAVAEGPRPLRGLRAEVAGLLMQGIAGGPLPLALALFPGSPAAAEPGLSYLLEIPAPPAGEAPAGRELEVYAYAVTPGGEVAAHQAVAVRTEPPAVAGLKVSGRLLLPHGDYSLRFLVYDPEARAYGQLVRPLAHRPRAPALRIADPCHGWSAAIAGGEDLTAVSARPVLLAGQRLEVRTPRLAAPEGGWRLHVQATPGDAPAQILAAAAAAADHLSFDLPALAQGVYSLSLVGAGGGPGAFALEAWVVSALPEAGGGCRRSWSGILRLAGASRGAEAAARASPAILPDKAGADLARAYRDVLRDLAESGDLESAAGRLSALEARIVERAVGALPAVHAAELATARRLAKRDPRCLIPLVSLHAEAYSAHFAAGRYPLATHSRRLAAAVAELSADRLKSPEDRKLIAAAITGLAGEVEGHRMSLAAQGLLERALDLDGELEAARLLLAVSYERSGRFDDARRQLGILVGANAAHLEGRLRLAVLQRRSGRLAAAERQVKELIGERPPDWLLSLAYQTLAHVLGARDRHAEAVEHLRRATARLPRDQALHLLLAYALDRRGERAAAAEVLADLPPAATAGATPRYRYSDAPAEALGLLWVTLEQSITVRLPILAQVLRQETAGGPAP